MNETPTAPPPPPPGHPHEPAGEPADHGGPRVSGDEIRDLTRLRRTSVNKHVAGVAGGIARHLDIDPLITRVLFVVLAFFGGAGVIAYGVCWLILPSDTEEAPVRLDNRSRTVALVITGAIAALAVIGDSLGGFGFPWPLVIIGVVVLAVVLARGDRGYPGSWRPQPGTPLTPPAAPAPDQPVTRAVPTQYVKPAHPRRRGPILFGYTLLLIMVALGVLGMVDLAGADIADAVYPLTALGITGGMLVLSGFWGRGGGLILLGFAAALCAAGAVGAHKVDAGRIDAHPYRAEMVESPYELTIGEIRLDLSDVSDPENLDGQTIVVRVDLGRAYIVVPDDLDVTVRSKVDLGHREVFGKGSNSDSGTSTFDGGKNVPELTLDVSVDVGEIVVVTEGENR